MGPHLAVGLSEPRHLFAAALFDRLWSRYRKRVEFVQTYEKLIADESAVFVNDHIAFRTISWQDPFCGIAMISRIFEALGFHPAGGYSFPDKCLSAIHLAPPDPRLPKIFISELRAGELPKAARDAIGETLGSHRPAPTQEFLTSLATIENDTDEAKLNGLLEHSSDWFFSLPWDVPQKSAVELVNESSQYGAWTMLHGYGVNHFTSLIDSHGVPALDNIDKTVEALKNAGVPMKGSIEGDADAALRQTATQAVTIDVPVHDEAGETITMPWTYAYFELAQRAMQEDKSGNPWRFEGFLGPQATNLFEMTRTSKQ